MNNIVTIHSFRQSVGKSTLAANLASALALDGRRVGLVDSDFQGASAHLFFGLKDGDLEGTFNDYFWKKCNIIQAAHDITDRLAAPADGKLFLVPASTQISDIMQMLRTTMNIDRYTEALGILEKELALDIILVDTRAGLNENTMTSIALSNSLLVVLHPDAQDFQGTAVTVDVARKLMVQMTARKPWMRMKSTSSLNKLTTAKVLFSTIQKNCWHSPAVSPLWWHTLNTN